MKNRNSKGKTTQSKKVKPLTINEETKQIKIDKYFSRFIDELFEIIETDVDVEKIEEFSTTQMASYQSQIENIEADIGSQGFIRLEMSIRNKISTYISSKVENKEDLEIINQSDKVPTVKKIVENAIKCPVPKSWEFIFDVFNAQLKEFFNMIYYINHYKDDEYQTTRAMIDSNKDKVKNVSDQLETILTTLIDKKDKLDNLDKLYKDSEEKWANERIRNIEIAVTVLGIFASIVLTYYTVSSFTTSVLSNISNANVYKLLLITLVIGLVGTSIVFGLIYYLNSLRHSVQLKSRRKDCDCKNISVCEKQDKNATGIKMFIVYIISMAIIIVSIVVVAFAWKNNWLDVNYANEQSSEEVETNSASDNNIEDNDIELID